MQYILAEQPYLVVCYSLHTATQPKASQLQFYNIPCTLNSEEGRVSNGSAV